MNREDDRRISGLIVATAILFQLVIVSFIFGLKKYETAESAFMAAGLSLLALVQLNFSWSAIDPKELWLGRSAAALIGVAALIHAAMAVIAQYAIAEGIASALVIAGVSCQMAALFRRKRLS